ncbi:MAG: hypothetical protein KJ887_00970 [Candidatus Omnitrophica bacterium]|nr:hypothetical protein [Candidatus Omnitrophota bacterium]MBU1047229.1 hypothetical protein [Candidatus Omnitrophota bacterium]MBU1631230.1 hypothetical protein [Candidatus Omnitrophota bacterium]MBU1889185.1 hypothetical protein [Candidatus Omnitrophota bacterium]
MKKRSYFITTIIVLLAIITLAVVQISLSSKIKQTIKNWAGEYGIEISDFKCNVNLLTGNINFKNLTLKQKDNVFKIKQGYITFKISEFLSDRSIKGIHITKAELMLENFIPFSFPAMTEKPFAIDEIEIKNLILKIGPSNGETISDINISGSLKGIGTNKKTTFSINASANSSFVEIKGDFDFDDWKKRLTYHVFGKDISLEILNTLEEKFLPVQIREQLLSLYLKDVLTVDIKGKMNITGDGKINEQNIDSKLKFLVYELSCETENQRIKSLIKKVKSKGVLEIDYKIYGTTSNPFLTYDIAF